LHFFISCLTIIAIDVLLAGDNAVIIAMAARTIPKERRKVAIAAGAGMAVILRVAITFVAAQLLEQKFVQLLGGAVILWIAVKLFLDTSPESAAELKTGSFWRAIQFIVLADLTMSLDNVLAVAAASKGNIYLLIGGLGLSIPFVVFTSNFLSILMEKYPVLVYVGAAILGRVGGEMIMTDPFIVQQFHPAAAVRYGVEAFCAVAVVVAGRLWPRRANPKDVGMEARKQAVALKSLAAAVALTSFKIVVGLLTGSLGILAEAAHSGLDLVAAAATYFAVRTASRPADRDHRYGHGKIENLSALFETVLLLATCAWIVYAAIHRLLKGGVEVEITVWSFLVMLTSIGIDWSRSRALYRVAKESNSQALEADALHFQTDIWSSSVVIVGLICVKVAQRAPAVAWLRHADAVAALAVAVIAGVVTVRLGTRTVQALMDAAPANIQDRIVRAAATVSGVIDCHSVRFRYSGPTLFVDAHVLMDSRVSLFAAHEIADQVERAIQAELPGANVTVHSEPAGPA